MNDMKRKKRVLPIFLAAVLLGIAALLLLARANKPPQDESVPVNDGTGTIWIRPDPALPVNSMSVTDFFRQDGVVTYNGESYTACQGVDVSDWQNEIQWQLVADSGIDFAVIRCGYRSYGIGELRIDNQFEANYTGAGSAGLRRGVYFFSQAVSVKEAQEEAAYVLQLLQDKPLELPVFYDWEPVSDPEGRANNVSGEIVTDCAAAFCKIIADSGRTAGVYFNKQIGYHTYDLSPLKDYTFWVADLGSHPSFYYHAALWQYDHKGTVSGIHTAADRNLLFEKKVS